MAITNTRAKEPAVKSYSPSAELQGCDRFVFPYPPLAAEFCQRAWCDSSILMSKPQISASLKPGQRGGAADRREPPADDEQIVLAHAGTAVLFNPNLSLIQPQFTS
ncbi:hypothetical protein PoB_000931700 [Plakobranchus ocellatus]|uniref:Uncharacterized protein n=1 Tax=Plakobranchus ocellatus TaxID=259542 RepID=A0AAV3YK85_9GAST|nr:hypothetical protein PoB_000931700 [Plakobranchus ocellatus]